MGAGHGALEIPLIHLLTAQGMMNLDFFCDDISSVMHDEFWAKVEAAGVTRTVRDYKVVDFEDPAYTPPIADLSISSHVWYFLSTGNRRRKVTTRSLNFEERSGLVELG